LNAGLIVHFKRKVRRFEPEYAAKLNTSRELTMRAKRTEERLKQVDFQTLSDQIELFYQTILLRNLKWMRLLAALEDKMPDRARLVRITPSFSQDMDRSSATIQLEGVSKSFDQIPLLMKNLENSPFFDKVYVVKISKERDSKDYEFSLEMNYYQPME